MELSPELQIQSVIKALQDTVIPALDPDNAMAQEQAQLCLAMLGFTQSRLPQLEDYARRDLEHWLDLAESADIAETTEIDAACEQARSSLNDATATRTDRESAARALRRALGEAIEQVQPNSAEAAGLARLVVTRSAAIIELERAWLATLGIENDASLPTIESLLEKRT